MTEVMFQLSAEELERPSHRALCAVMGVGRDPSRLRLPTSLVWDPAAAAEEEAEAWQLTLAKHNAIISVQRNTLLLRCDLATTTTTTAQPVVLKLRYPLHSFQTELDVTRALHEQGPETRQLLPKLHGFLHVVMPDGRQFGAICMQSFATSANHLVYPPASQRYEEALQHATLRFALWTTQHQASPACSLGVPVPMSVSDSHDHHHGDDALPRMRTALVAGCLRALEALHASGWCHGDSYLGNFAVDTRRWRVYLIDFERSFRTDDRAQHFLDLQELFGHACSVLVAEPNRNAWDWADTLPTLHRLVHRPPGDEDPRVAVLLLLLPICACFVNYRKEKRLRGCTLCRSAFQRGSMEKFYRSTAPAPELLAQVSLARLQDMVRGARAAAHRVLDPLLDDLVPLLLPDLNDELLKLPLEVEGHRALVDDVNARRKSGQRPWPHSYSSSTEAQQTLQEHRSALAERVFELLFIRVFLNAEEEGEGATALLTFLTDRGHGELAERIRAAIPHPLR